MKISGQEKKVTLPIYVRERTSEVQWFEVNPQAINQRLFQKKRKDKEQEKTRKLIQKAFAEVKYNPEKYGRKFKTMMPKKTWESKTVEELKQLACKLGDHNADWVEQALEWAQRINNGASWEAVCNNPDTTNWYRLVEWEDGLARIVGGSLDYQDGSPASYVYERDYYSGDRIIRTVPLVVSYEK